MHINDLHLAVALGTLADVKAAIAKGTDVNAKEWEGLTPLHLATIFQKKDILRALVAKGAAIYAKDSGGAAPLSIASANERIDLLAILHHVESHLACTSTATLRKYFEKKFPTCRDLCQKDLEWLRKTRVKLFDGKDPFAELRSISSNNPISVNDVRTLLRKDSHPVLEGIVQCLKQNSSLFAKALEIANRHKKLIIDEFDGSSENMMYNTMGSPACYDPFLHEINIEKSCDLRLKAEMLIFETMNALQGEGMRNIFKLSEAGMLNRNEFTLLCEYLEYFSLLWTFRILGRTSHRENFLDFWKDENTPYPTNPGKGAIHADIYRRQWDFLYGFPYLKKHAAFPS